MTPLPIRPLPFHAEGTTNPLLSFRRSGPRPPPPPGVSPQYGALKRVKSEDMDKKEEGGGGAYGLGLPSIVSTWGTESWRKKRPRPDMDSFIDEPQALMEKVRDMEDTKVRTFLTQPKRYQPGSRLVPSLKGVLGLSEGESVTDIRTMGDAPYMPYRFESNMDELPPQPKRRTMSNSSSSSPPSPGLMGGALLTYRRGPKRPPLLKDDSSFTRGLSSGPPTPVDELLPDMSEDEEDIDVLDRVLIEPPMHFKVVSSTMTLLYQPLGGQTF